MPQHNPSQTLALRITMAKALSDASLYWSSPSGSIPSYNGTYQNNAFSLSPAQVEGWGGFMESFMLDQEKCEVFKL